MEKTGSSIHRKASAHQHKAEVRIAGEQLRLRLHDCKLIKDRRYHLRTYPNCFVAQELIDWLIAHKEAPDRSSAVRVMQFLMDHDIVHHVCDKQSTFKDAKLLYRFRKDDGTFPFNMEMKVFMRGQRLYEHLVSGKNSILQQQVEQGGVNRRVFAGCQLIDWLLQNGEADCRRQGIELCRALLEHGIIQHVEKKHHFFDSPLLYRFCINFRRQRRLAELLSEGGAGEASPAENDPLDSPFVLRKTPPEEEKSSFLSVQPSKEIRVTSTVHRGGVTSQQMTQDGYFPPSPLLPLPLTRCNPKSVLKRSVTREELMCPGAPFVRKVLTVSDNAQVHVVGDAVGWGFVVRGSPPCYVQAVEPGGPAATGGVKVRQFISQVNGRCVLHLDYRVVTRLVMMGPRTVVLEVMEPLD
ncbi:DEP domain-containing mTOR-interacting protein isoform X1 [Paramormyrops kingsleyae]|uniref:DEP domain-containing mTOR-interacting protein isoform X1 n=1 Tax=Paramormyrops kingsleyae TaxID=1676925 RepID=UPI000CD5DF38|nr:DEP domain-containing mTOR-interacting protein-like isoform X1 [Paramormyrops kingsleyae]